MVKRISCRVISSVPFNKTSDGFPSVSQPNNHQYNSGDTGLAVAKPRTIVIPVKNTDILSIGPRTLDFPIGQILDCYA